MNKMAKEIFTHLLKYNMFIGRFFSFKTHYNGRSIVTSLRRVTTLFTLVIAFFQNVFFLIFNF